MNSGTMDDETRRGLLTAAREAQMDDDRIEEVARAARAAYYLGWKIVPSWEDTGCRNQWRDVARAVITLLGREKSQTVVPGDVIREMLDRWYGDMDGMSPYDAAQVKHMTAAASCLLARPEVLGEPSEEEWETAMAAQDGSFLDAVKKLVANRRSRLLLPVERVTFDNTGLRLDGKLVDSYEVLKLAAAGLRAQLRDGE